MPPDEPAVKAVRVAAVEVRRGTAWVNHLKDFAQTLRVPKISDLVANLERVKADRAVAAVLLRHHLGLQGLRGPVRVK